MRKERWWDSLLMWVESQAGGGGMGSSMMRWVGDRGATGGWRKGRCYEIGLVARKEQRMIWGVIPLGWNEMRMMATRWEKRCQGVCWVWAPAD